MKKKKGSRITKTFFFLLLFFFAGSQLYMIRGRTEVLCFVGKILTQVFSPICNCGTWNVFTMEFIPVISKVCCSTAIPNYHAYYSR